MAKWLLVGCLVVVLCVLAWMVVRGRQSEMQMVDTPAGMIVALEGATTQDAERVGAALARVAVKGQVVLVARPRGRLQVSFGMAKDAASVAEAFCVTMGSAIRPEVGEPITVRAVDRDLNLLREVQIDEVRALSESEANARVDAGATRIFPPASTPPGR